MMKTAEFVAGQLVQVRSKEEILATLDARAQIDGLPFMPEMLEHCGRQFRVFKRAHKTCDPPSGISGRKMESAVHLEGLRCNGAMHGGCEARCLFFWKEAWLKSVDNDAPPPHAAAAGCTDAQLIAGTRAPGEALDAPEPTYVCQSTRVAVATTPLKWWDFRQYVEDYTSGNVRLSTMAGSFFAYVWHELVMAGLGVGAALRAGYDAFQRLRGGTPYPWRFGALPSGSRTPVAELNLQPGELVRVKPYDAILETITEDGLNRGMSFDAEMVPFCGGTYRVLARINKLIHEKTGKMIAMKTACIVLEDVACTACYAAFRRFCPRAIYPYWREIWLERAAVAETAAARAVPALSPAPSGGSETAMAGVGVRAPTR
jgi:hypothetical protein